MDFRQYLGIGVLLPRMWRRFDAFAALLNIPDVSSKTNYYFQITGYLFINWLTISNNAIFIN